MKCPAVLAPPNKEYIQCDSDFIQVGIEWCDHSFFFCLFFFFSSLFFFFAFKVTREIPVDNWNNEVISNKCVDMWGYEEMNVSNVEYFWCDFSIQLDWSLALSGSLVVALEDSSLLQVNVEMHKPNITVQGRRDTILSPVQVRLCQFVAGRICNSLSIEQKLPRIFLNTFYLYEAIWTILNHTVCLCGMFNKTAFIYFYFLKQSVFLMILFYQFTASSLNKSNFWEKKSCLAGIAKRKRGN